MTVTRSVRFARPGRVGVLVLASLLMLVSGALAVHGSSPDRPGVVHAPVAPMAPGGDAEPEAADEELLISQAVMSVCLAAILGAVAVIRAGRRPLRPGRPTVRRSAVPRLDAARRAPPPSGGMAHLCVYRL